MKKFLKPLVVICFIFPALINANLKEYLKFEQRIYIINLSRQNQDIIELLCQELRPKAPGHERIVLHRGSAEIQEAPFPKVRQERALQHLDSATNVIVLIDEYYGQAKSTSEDDPLRTAEHDWVVTQSIQEITQSGDSVPKSFYFLGTSNPQAGAETVQQQLSLAKPPIAIPIKSVLAEAGILLRSQTLKQTETSARRKPSKIHS